MPLPKIDEARALSDQELADEILVAKRELFELRLQQATRRLEKPHQFKHLKHRIAQMMTVAQERKLTKESEAKGSKTDQDSGADAVVSAKPKNPSPESEAKESVTQADSTTATPESSASDLKEEE